MCTIWDVAVSLSLLLLLNGIVDPNLAKLDLYDEDCCSRFSASMNHEDVNQDVPPARLIRLSLKYDQGANPICIGCGNKPRMKISQSFVFVMVHKLPPIEIARGQIRIQTFIQPL